MKGHEETRAYLKPETTNMNRWLATIVILGVVFIPTIHVVEKNCKDYLGSNGVDIVANMKNARASAVCSHFSDMGLEGFVKFTHKLAFPNDAPLKLKVLAPL